MSTVLFCDRVSDSPIDLKLDLFNPAIKRLHIDIPARPIQLPPVPTPIASGFDQHGSAAFSSRPDVASTSSSTVRDLSVDRNVPSTAISAITVPAIGQSCILYTFLSQHFQRTAFFFCGLQISDWIGFHQGFLKTFWELLERWIFANRMSFMMLANSVEALDAKCFIVVLSLHREA